MPKKSPMSDQNFADDTAIDSEPPIIDPYVVLEVQKDATTSDIKKSYHKLALKHHPDKVAEGTKDAAHKKFQEIAFAYAVLSDDRRRKRYDATGNTAETIEDDEDFDWLSFYREQWAGAVNEEFIQKLSDEYKGSAEERQDLLKYYKKARGNLNAIYQCVMLSDILVDDDRFRQILDDEIKNGNINSYPAYARETDSTRQKAKDVERKRREDFDEKHGKTETQNSKKNSKAKPKAGKKASSEIGDLAALIQQRQKSRLSLFDQLEAKYAGKSRNSKRSRPMDEPPEEAFQEVAARQKRRLNSQPKKASSEDEDEEINLEEDVIPSDEDEDIAEEEVRPKKGKAKTKAKAKVKAKAKR